MPPTVYWDDGHRYHKKLNPGQFREPRIFGGAYTSYHNNPIIPPNVGCQVPGNNSQENCAKSNSRYDD
jgi:hypothetical protein